MSTWWWWCWDCMRRVGYSHIKRVEDSGGCTGYCSVAASEEKEKYAAERT